MTWPCPNDRAELEIGPRKEMHVWLKLERGRVPDGGSIAGAIDYSLNSWTALTRHLEDGAVPLDNNFLERQISLGQWEGARGSSVAAS